MWFGHGITRKGGIPRDLLCRFARAAGSAGLALAVSGCFLDLDKPDVALETPKSYREAGGGGAEAAVPPLDWWRTFRTPELTNLVQQATTNNFTIAIAIAQILQADAQVRVTGAALLPTVSYDADDTASRTSKQVEKLPSQYSRLYGSSL